MSLNILEKLKILNLFKSFLKTENLHLILFFKTYNGNLNTIFFQFEPLIVSINPLIIKKKCIESKEILKFQKFQNL